MITGWATASAAALTAGFAVGAAHGNHTATHATAAAQTAGPATQIPDQSQEFTPPSTSTAPPQGMSGGS